VEQHDELAAGRPGLAPRDRVSVMVAPDVIVAIDVFGVRRRHRASVGTSSPSGRR
jgi:hypothetical protein